MDSSLSRYACDECRQRKIRCSRDLSGCVQCVADSRACQYSRAGVIRRNRKRKQPSVGNGSLENNVPITTTAYHSTDSTFQSQLETDIRTTQESLKKLPDRELNCSDVLSSLSSEYTSFWQDQSFLEMAERSKDRANRFFTFEEEGRSWIETMAHISGKGKPMFNPIPQDILQDAVRQPEKVRHKAHLVLFYGIILTEVSADPSCKKETKLKLRWNLWLSLNDARLLLEPTELNISALILLAIHVQDFHTPSLCWMLTNTACRMLQALGINIRTLDQETREKRRHLFWFLNLIDKSLALIFGKPPTFHPAMCLEIPLPSYQSLTAFEPHMHHQSLKEETRSQAQHTSLFGAHFLRQAFQLTTIMSDIWSCLFDATNEAHTIEETKAKLDKWHQDTTTILNASYLTEKPFLPREAQYSMELGIKSFEFQYHQLTVQLIRSVPKLRQECLRASREALSKLDDLVSDSGEVYNGIIWQLLYCPLTPFFVLFGDILSKHGSESKKSSLDAMELLPPFLQKMIPRHPLAAKLYNISTSLMQQARRIFSKSATPKQATKSDHPEAVDSHTADISTMTSPSVSGIGDIPPGQANINSTAPAYFEPDSVLSFLNDLPSVGFYTDLAYPFPGSDSISDTTSLAASTQGLDMLTDDGAGSSPEYQLSNLFTQSTFDWFAWDSSNFGRNENPFAL